MSTFAGGGVTFVVSFLVVSLPVALFDEPQLAIEPIIAAINAKFTICFFIVYFFVMPPIFVKS